MTVDILGHQKDHRLRRGGRTFPLSDVETGLTEARREDFALVATQAMGIALNVALQHSVLCKGWSHQNQIAHLLISDLLDFNYHQRRLSVPWALGREC